MSQDMPLASREPEFEEKPQENLNEKEQESQDLLVECISQNVGFAEGKPVAASLIYKCLSHWRSFEVEESNIFDRIIQTLRSAIEVQDDNEVLTYWLSNSATLLLLLQHTKAIGQQRQTTTSTSLFGRMTLPQFMTSFGRQGLNKPDELRQVDKKYPAILFKQQLTEFLEKIYEMIRENLKKEISPYLELCIQASQDTGYDDTPQQDPTAHWESIIKGLNTYLNVMKVNNAPSFLVRKVLKQVFSFINIQLFNSLLQRHWYSLENAEYVEAGLAKLKEWCVNVTDEYAGSAWDELMHIRQAVGFLVLRRKPKMTRKVCPVLSPQQRYKISKFYWENKYGTSNNVSEISRNIRLAMEESDECHLEDDKGDDTFLLEDDSSIPFTVKDISKSMKKVDLYDIKLPKLIRENPEVFGFLLARES